MKTRIIKSIFTLAFMLIALPMMGQDWMEIQFKDGTYSKFFLEDLSTMEVTKYDSEDNINEDYQYQHIIVKDQHYFYNIDDIESVKFVKYDEELVESRIGSALEGIMPIMTQCETIEMAEESLDILKSQENVEDAWCEGDCLYIKVVNSGVIPFHYSHGENEFFTENESQNSMMQNSKALIKNVQKTMANGNGKELKVVIANQLHYDESKDPQFNLRNAFTPLTADFNSQSNIHADYIGKPTVDSFFLTDIFDYDVVLLVTHGDYYENDHCIMSADKLCEFEMNSYGQEERQNAHNKLKDFRKELRKNHPELPKLEDKHLWFGFSDEMRIDKNNQSCHKYWIAYPMLREPFFEKIAQNEQHNPNSIFFNGACKSMMKNTHFAETMYRKGFGTYFGYSYSNTVGPPAGSQFLYYLLQGYSLGKALDELPGWAKTNKQKDGKVAELETYPKTLVGKRNIFIMPTETIEINDDNATKSFNSNQSVIVSGIAKSLNPDYVGFYRFNGSKKLDDISVGFKCNDSRVSITDVQIVSRSKNEIRFTGRMKGLESGKSYSYYAYSYDGENYNYGDTYSFKIEKPSNTSCPDNHHPHMIDLGLPSGTKWACCNVGASNPEDYGGYYAWGETKEKDTYDWSTYLHCDGTEGTCHDIGTDIAGTKYDVAHVKWGSSWMMPSKNQCKELLDYCTSKWITEKGVEGSLIIGPNGRTLFFPDAGEMEGGTLGATAGWGVYWSSWRDESYVPHAYTLYFFGGEAYYPGNEGRRTGHSVRPVSSK